MVVRADGRAWQMRIIAIGALGCVALGALVVSLVHSGGRPAPRIVDAAVLTSGSSFGLSGTVGNLTPGISSRLILKVTNHTSRAIRLRAVTIKVRVTPAHCPVANLTVNGARFAGSPPAVTIAGLSARVPARGVAKVPLTMRLARAAANGCQHARFPLSYSGIATSGLIGNVTTTRLTSFPNPSAPGLPVAFIAIVRSAALRRSRPIGHVTFYRCTNPRRLPARSPASACHRSVPLGRPVVTGRGLPAVLVVASLRPGAHSIFARFRPARPGVLASASTTITQRVIFAFRGGRSAIWGAPTR